MATAQPQHQRHATQAPRPRILRIGVILGGNIIEERLLRVRETVTLGQSTKNTFSIPLADLPKSWPLFLLENNRYVLQLTDNMDGRLSTGDQVHTLGALKEHGAQRRGNYWALPLDERSRGKIVIGEMTLLFQFVTAPPLQPRPRLPASVRGSFADRIDPHLAIILLLSLLIHSTIAIYAYTRDMAVMSRTDKLHRQFQEEQFQDRVISETFDMPEISTEVATEEVVEDGEGGEDESDDEPAPRTREPKGDGGDGGDDGATPDDAAVRETIANTALVAAITAGEGEGSRYSQMSDTDQGADLDKAIEDAKGKKVGTHGGGSGDRRTRGPNTGEIGTDKGEKVGGPGPGEKVAAKKEEKVSRVKLGGVDDLSLTDLDPGEVARLIRSRYLAGIKRCHQDSLKKDPSAGGRVNIRFTVGPTGRVTAASVDGFNPSVDSCIQAQARRWRFGAPKEDGKPSSADFVIPLILQPGA